MALWAQGWTQIGPVRIAAHPRFTLDLRGSVRLQSAPQRVRRDEQRTQFSPRSFCMNSAKHVPLLPSTPGRPPELTRQWPLSSCSLSAAQRIRAGLKRWRPQPAFGFPMFTLFHLDPSLRHGQGRPSCFPQNARARRCVCVACRPVSRARRLSSTRYLTGCGLCGGDGAGWRAATGFKDAEEESFRRSTAMSIN
jgi:hypothetical protein